MDHVNVFNWMLSLSGDKECVVGVGDKNQTFLKPRMQEEELAPPHKGALHINPPKRRRHSQRTLYQDELTSSVPRY